MRKELLNEMVQAIGCRVEQIGKDMQDSIWGGLSQKLEQLRRLVESAEAVEKMKMI